MSRNEMILFVVMIVAIAVGGSLDQCSRGKDYQGEAESWKRQAEQQEAAIELLKQDRDSLEKVILDIRTRLAAEKKRTKALKNELEKIPHTAAAMELDSVARDVSGWLVDERGR